jgi:putative SOS response-associated peptidase YedK
VTARTIGIITVPSNELIAQIHDRMPLILPKNKNA